MEEIAEIVIVSGGMDPVHKGHIRLINEASRYGAVYCILNSDEWLTRKKGKPFMKWEDRAEIMMAIRGVCCVKRVDDADGSVCKALEVIRTENPDTPIFFANGGDRMEDNVPEVETCKRLNIKMLFNMGGAKTASSSDLIKGVGGYYFDKKAKKD